MSTYPNKSYEQNYYLDKIFMQVKVIHSVTHLLVISTISYSAIQCMNSINITSFALRSINFVLYMHLTFKYFRIKSLTKTNFFLETKDIVL